MLQRADTILRVEVWFAIISQASIAFQKQCRQISIERVNLYMCICAYIYYLLIVTYSVLKNSRIKV